MSYNEKKFLVENIPKTNCVFVEENYDLMQANIGTINISRAYFNDSDYCYSGYGNMKISSDMKVRSLG